MSRRSFLVGAAALGVTVAAGGSILEACGRTEPSTIAPSGAGGSSSPFDGEPPIVLPTPVSATYGSMLETTGLLVATDLSSSLRALVDEAAGETGIPLDTGAAAGGRRGRLAVTTGNASIPTQAYRLEVAESAAAGPAVTIEAGDEAGALNGLLSLRQLVVRDASTTWLRAATIDDAPGFSRRGAILDPAPQTGVSTPESRAQLLGRVRLGVRHKLNFVDLPGRTPWPELVRFCDDHHVELMVGWGYRDALTTVPRQQLKEQLAAQQDAGARSVSLAWDDISTRNPEALAGQHAEVFRDLYAFLRRRDPDVRVSAVLPPYGGIPGRQLVGSTAGEGERYLAAMKAALPGDVRIFWTGDGGVFSSTVTAAGARAYADAIGHELGLWDNDTIRFSAARRPCSGRAGDLATVVRSYMGNLAGEANWGGTNGEFALLTALFYTWNPAAYQPGAAATSAERILAG